MLRTMWCRKALASIVNHELKRQIHLQLEEVVATRLIGDLLGRPRKPERSKNRGSPTQCLGALRMRLDIQRTVIPESLHCARCAGPDGIVVDTYDRRRRYRRKRA